MLFKRSLKRIVLKMEDFKMICKQNHLHLKHRSNPPLDTFPSQPWPTSLGLGLPTLHKPNSGSSHHEPLHFNLYNQTQNLFIACEFGQIQEALLLETTLNQFPWCGSEERRGLYKLVFFLVTLPAISCLTKYFIYICMII